MLAQAKGYAYVCKPLLLLGVCNAFPLEELLLGSIASFYAYGPMSVMASDLLITVGSPVALGASLECAALLTAPLAVGAARRGAGQQHPL